MNPKKPFWRPDQPLTEAELRLWRAVMRAHRLSVERENLSAHTLRNTFAGSGSYTNALAGALLTLGGPHAPIWETMSLLARDEPWVRVPSALLGKQLVPGWGNSFAKKKKDELWLAVDDLLKQDFIEMFRKLENTSLELHRWGKLLYPNPSAYTAATALLLGIPPVIAPFIFVQGRLEGWAELVLGMVRNAEQRTSNTEHRKEKE